MPSRRSGQRPALIQADAFRRDAGRALRQVVASRRPLVITERGRRTAVLVSAKLYDRAEHERAMLESLVRGDREIATGRGHDLDRVITETRKRLRHS